MKIDSLVFFGSLAALPWLVVVALMLAPPRPAGPIGHIQPAFVHQGEWVTTEAGAPVCQIMFPLFRGMVLDFEFCTNWKIERPRDLCGNSEWIRCRHGGVDQFHTGRGWKP